MFARPERGDGLLVGRIAREVVAADPLERDDQPVGERPGRRRDGVALGRTSAGADETQLRAADGARVRLCVEAPVAGIVVLSLASGTHPERRHRRRGTVVGHAAHDAEAGAAVRAVDERVAVAAIPRVAQLGETLLASRDVGRDRRRPGCRAGR